MTETNDRILLEPEETLVPPSEFPIYFSQHLVRVGKVNFLVESHYCGWEGIERRLGALMLEDILGEGGDEKGDAEG